MFRRRQFTSAIFITALFLGITLSATAEEAAVGQVAPTLELPDQHGKLDKVSKSTQIVVLAFHMSISKSFNKWFDARGKDWLPQNNALYIADISGMPSTIAKWFALPKMRKYKHRVLLNRDETFAARFPVKKEMATILRINKSGRITSISHVASPEGFRKLLED